MNKDLPEKTKARVRQEFQFLQATQDLAIEYDRDSVHKPWDIYKFKRRDGEPIVTTQPGGYEMPGKARPKQQRKEIAGHEKVIKVHLAKIENAGYSYDDLEGLRARYADEKERKKMKNEEFLILKWANDIDKHKRELTKIYKQMG